MADLDCSVLNILSEENQTSCLVIRDTQIQAAIDMIWVSYTAIGILSLQMGFAMLEAGTVQAKNVKSVLMKNLTDTVFGAVSWWVLGYGIYKGDGEFISGEPYLFFITDAYVLNFPEFVQQYGFAATAVTIVSGSVLSRIRFETYVLFSVCFVPLVYSVAAHISWGDNGWLGALGFQDFAGSGVVHMVGGVAGLLGAILVGPRTGRFYADDEEAPGVVRKILPHSTALIVLGGFFLYVGWFSFNAGSSGSLDPESINDAKRAAVNTLLGSAAGGSITTVYSIFHKRQHDVPLIVNGMLSGLVSVTGPSAYVDTWAAIVIGSTAGLCFIPVSFNLLHRLSIDDPVDAFTVHGFSGALGVILTGVFSMQGGLIYSGNADLLVVQLIGVGVLGGWSFGVSLLIFLALRFTVGLRLPFDDQLMGLDDTYHHGSAYPEFDYLTIRAVDAAKKRESVRMAKSARKYGSGRTPYVPRRVSANNVSSKHQIHFV